jgi:DNA-binding CsgD family transcriptional regulator
MMMSLKQTAGSISSVAKLSLSIFDESELSVQVVGESGTLHYINRAGLRSAWGERYHLNDVIGRRLIDLGHAAYYKERMQFVSRQIQLGRPGIVRSIRMGTQTLVHIHPVTDHSEFAEPIVLVIAARSNDQQWRAAFGDIDVLEPTVQDLGQLALLSRRELEVLAYVGMGMGVDETAARLHRSRETVISHRKSLMRKLACGNASQLAMFAFRAGLHPRDAGRLSDVNSHLDVS